MARSEWVWQVLRITYTCSGGSWLRRLRWIRRGRRGWRWGRRWDSSTAGHEDGLPPVGRALPRGNHLDGHGLPWVCTGEAHAHLGKAVAAGCRRIELVDRVAEAHTHLEAGRWPDEPIP